MASRRSTVVDKLPSDRGDIHTAVRLCGAENLIKGDMTMKVYIAGKVTGLDRTETVAKFERAAELFREKGHEPFIPTVLPDYRDVPHEDYMHVCKSIIDICDGIYLLNDWKQSPGACQELEYAFALKKKILEEGINDITESL